jgi:hypothetical protein
LKHWQVQAGHVYERVVALPRDELLLYNLPQFHMLPHFGIEKSDVTCGMHIVEATFEHARMSNMPSGEIAIDVARLPSPLAAPLPTPPPPIGGQGRDAIIGTNGERLFMLSSRVTIKKI